ncbi:MAG TPA: cell wall metabolism sensor histidine kinase WalK [Firmicutes bacterium]|nr:cell wall metabolism sensor histidine kinase WalK [Bacillota bacterium]
MKWNILSKLTLSFWAIVLLVTGITTVFLNRAFQEHFVTTIDSSLKANARMVSDLLLERGFPGGMPGRLPQIQEITERVARDVKARVTIIDPSGAVLSDSQKNAGLMNNHADRPEVKQALAGKTGTSTRFSRTILSTMRYIAVPVISDGKVVAVVRLAVPLTEINRTRDRIRSRLMVAAFISILLSGGIAYLLARSLAEPLRDMITVASRIAGGDFSKRVRITARDEIGCLADALNHMADRLSTTIQEMSEERNKIKAILASMADGVVAVDSDNRIILMNRAAEQMFGITEGAAYGRKFLEAIRNYELVEALSGATRGEVHSAEFKVFSPNERILRVSATCIESTSDQPAGVVAVIQDVTELRRLEQLRTEFVSNVSHELRTPLTSIKGFVETLLDGAMEDGSTATRFLGIIQNEANRLERLISDLLDLSRIESGQIALRKVPCHLDKLTQSVCTFLHGQADAKQLSLEINIPADFPQVPADKDLLRQVFINLIDNAIKYTPAGGRVIIYGSDSGDSVTIHVEDTGVGIPKAHLSRLFERFYRVDKARSRELGGTGLGLAIVKHIIDRHGGKVWIESEVGKGTRVSFTLPKS